MIALISVASTSISSGASSTFGESIIKYDEQGNRTQEGDQYYTWDNKSRLIEVRNTDHHAKYSYDYNNQRRIKWVKDSEGNETSVLYISKDAEIRNNKLIKFVRLGSQRISKSDISILFKTTFRLDRVVCG